MAKILASFLAEEKTLRKAVFMTPLFFEDIALIIFMAQSLYQLYWKCSFLELQATTGSLVAYYPILANFLIDVTAPREAILVAQSLLSWTGNLIWRRWGIPQQVVNPT